jgi:hypothetical protein
MGVLSNLVHACLGLGQHAEALQHLHELRTLPAVLDLPYSEDLELRLFCTTTSLELDLHGRTGDFQKAIELIPMVERGLAQHGERLGPVRKAGFYYQIAYVHFGAGVPDKTLKWLHRLLNDVRIDESTELVCFARILQLMAAFDSGKTDLIPHNLRNTERFFLTRDRSHHFEERFVQLMHALQRSRERHLQLVAFATFLKHLSALEDNPLERVVFDHLDPIAWADAHLNGRTFGEMVRVRAMRPAKAA